MPPITLLIKPASGNCNMRCRYCFYTDITQIREKPSFGMMSTETLEAIVQKTLSEAKDICTFAFQGGEPTLAGLDFYRKLIDFEKKYNVQGIKINNAIQTNGYVINEEWAAFFATHQFLVGLSLDGVKDIHDLHRLDTKGSGTYKSVMYAVQLFEQHKVEFNILTVVTAQIAKSIGKVYGFYKRNHLFYQQYIPCIDPFYDKHGQNSYSLTPKLYAHFLKTLFNLWYQDIMKGEFVYNRYFENLVGMLMGRAPESCGMLGQCMKQLVIEADGSVYPCDFYVLDNYKIGSLVTDSFEQIEERRKEIGFIETSLYVDERCKSCKWANLCRGGCRRDREPVTEGRLSLNCYCEAYREFFEYAYDRLVILARKFMK